MTVKRSVTSLYLLYIYPGHSKPDGLLSTTSPCKLRLTQTSSSCRIRIDLIPVEWTQLSHSERLHSSKQRPRHITLFQHLRQDTPGKTGISCYKSTKHIYTGLTIPWTPLLFVWRKSIGPLLSGQDRGFSRVLGAAVDGSQGDWRANCTPKRRSDRAVWTEWKTHFKCLDRVQLGHI